RALGKSGRADVPGYSLIEPRRSPLRLTLRVDRSGDARDIGRNTDRTDCVRRPTRNAGAVRAAPRTRVPVRPADGSGRVGSGRPEQRSVSLRVASGGSVRGAVRGSDVVVGDRAIQGSHGLATQAR